MKTISLRQPWASLIVGGYLRGLTLDWSRTYRGPLAIHVNKGGGEDAEALFRHEPHRSVLRSLGYDTLDEMPRNVILGVVLLATIQLTEELLPQVPENEVSFGEARLKRYVWLFAHPTLLIYPPAIPGRAGLFDTRNGFILPEIDADRLEFWRQALMDQRG
jgi:hypothetical protein